MVGCARGALLREVADRRDAPVEVRDRWDEFAVVMMVMVEADVDLDLDLPVVAGPLRLASGRRLWAVSGRAGCAESDPVEADGAWVRVYSPATDGGIAPMLMVVGLLSGPDSTSELTAGAEGTLPGAPDGAAADRAETIDPRPATPTEGFVRTLRGQ